jgi:hypothetical protein
LKFAFAAETILVIYLRRLCISAIGVAVVNEKIGKFSSGGSTVGIAKALQKMKLRRVDFELV